MQLLGVLEMYVVLLYWKHCDLQCLFIIFRHIRKSWIICGHINWSTLVFFLESNSLLIFVALLISEYQIHHSLCLITFFSMETLTFRISHRYFAESQWSIQVSHSLISYLLGYSVFKYWCHVQRWGIQCNVQTRVFC